VVKIWQKRKIVVGANIEMILNSEVSTNIGTKLKRKKNNKNENGKSKKEM
jgi:hypothetical protein